MNVEIGTEAVQFPEKEYINWIFLAVWYTLVASVPVVVRLYLLPKGGSILYFPSIYFNILKSLRFSQKLINVSFRWDLMFLIVGIIEAPPPSRQLTQQP
jgi:hypothetical protein